MTDWTDERLTALHNELDALCTEIEQVADWCESNARGLIADNDWHALGIAASVAHRLMLDVKYPHSRDDSSYFLRRAKVAA